LDTAIRGIFFHLYGVAYGEGLYVAVGEDNTLLTSSDGAIWVPAVQAPSHLPSTPTAVTRGLSTLRITATEDGRAAI